MFSEVRFLWTCFQNLENFYLVKHTMTDEHELDFNNSGGNLMNGTSSVSKGSNSR
jgi:hypothetical protein